MDRLRTYGNTYECDFGDITLRFPKKKYSFGCITQFDCGDDIFIATDKIECFIYISGGEIRLFTRRTNTNEELEVLPFEQDEVFSTAERLKNLTLSQLVTKL